MSRCLSIEDYVSSTKVISSEFECKFFWSFISYLALLSTAVISGISNIGTIKATILMMSTIIIALMTVIIFKNKNIMTNSAIKLANTNILTTSFYMLTLAGLIEYLFLTIFKTSPVLIVTLLCIIVSCIIYALTINIPKIFQYYARTVAGVSPKQLTVVVPNNTVKTEICNATTSSNIVKIEAYTPVVSSNIIRNEIRTIKCVEKKDKIEHNNALMQTIPDKDNARLRECAEKFYESNKCVTYDREFSINKTQSLEIYNCIINAIVDNNIVGRTASKARANYLKNWHNLSISDKNDNIKDFNDTQKSIENNIFEIAYEIFFWIYSHDVLSLLLPKEKGILRAMKKFCFEIKQNSKLPLTTPSERIRVRMNHINYYAEDIILIGAPIAFIIFAFITVLSLAFI